MQMQKRKQLFGAARREEEESPMSALTNSLLADKLARLSRGKREIQTWEADRKRILSALEQRQQAVRAEMSPVQGVDDPLQKRYMMKSLLQQWRETDLTLESQQRALHDRIVELAVLFTHELSVLAPYTPWLKPDDATVLMHGSVLVVIEELIGIYQRLEDPRAKPELARAIGELITTAVALDADAVHAHPRILQFRQESPYLRGDGGSISRNVTNARSLRQRSSARNLQLHRRALDR